jgi:hypothetical protein
VLTCFVYGLAFYAMRLPIGYRPPLPRVATPEPPRATPSLLAPNDRAHFLDKLTASMEVDYAYRDGELSLEQTGG